MPLFSQKLKLFNTKFCWITRPRFASQKKLGKQLLFGYEYWAKSGVITRLELYSNWNFKIQLLQIFERVRTGLVFMLRLNTILGFQYRASTRLRLQTFKTRLVNESREGTPIRRNLFNTPGTAHQHCIYFCFYWAINLRKR